MKAFIYITIFLFCQMTAYTQFTPFAYTYGGNGTVTGYDIVEANDSGYVCVGQLGSDGFTNGSSDMYAFKTNANGQLIWRKNYGGFNSEGAESITKGHGGGFLLAGYTNSFGSGGYDYFLVRVDEEGDTIWSKAYGGQDWDFAHAICTTSDGNYLVAGETFSYGSGGSDVWVLKINDAGDTLNSFLWGDTGDQTCKSIYESSPGVCVMAGYGTFPPFHDNEDAFMLSWNHISGATIFETVDTKPGNQQINSCDSSTTGAIIAFGSESLDDVKWDMYVSFYSQAGNFVSSPSLLEPGTTKELFAGANYRNIGYYVTGTRAPIGSSDIEIVYYRLDPSGYVNFGLVLAGSGLNSGQSLLESSDRGLVIAGTAEGFGPGMSAAIIWKIDSMMVPGTNPVPMLDMEEFAGNYEGVSLFPNPFTAEITITAPEETSILSLRIFNMEGKQVYSNQDFSGSTGQNIDLSYLKSGVYFTELELKGGHHHRAKLIKYP